MDVRHHLHTGALGDQKRAQDALELMLKVVVSHHGGDENSTMSFGCSQPLSGTSNSQCFYLNSMQMVKS